MKKKILILIAIILFFATSTASAHELGKGTIMVTGDTSFENSSIDIKLDGTTEKTDSTLFNVTGAYFVADNFAVGLMINNEDSDTDDGTSQTNQSMNMIGPIIGYNFSLNSDFSLMLFAGLFNLSGDMDYGASTSADIDGDGTMLMATVAYFISDNFTVNLGIRQTDADIDINIMSGGGASGDLSETAMTIGLSAYF